MAATLYIDSVTFGDITHVHGSECELASVRSYRVSDRIVALFNAWRWNLEPEVFLAGLIADAMDEEEGVEKDATWNALSAWMRKVFVEEIAPWSPNHRWHEFWKENVGSEVLKPR